jgi:hypothetical protein
MSRHEGSLPVLQEVLHGLKIALEEAKRWLRSAQDRQKYHADAHRRPIIFKEGDWVLLSTKNLRFPRKGRKMLLPTFLGPLKILVMVVSADARLLLLVS